MEHQPRRPGYAKRYADLHRLMSAYRNSNAADFLLAVFFVGVVVSMPVYCVLPHPACFVITPLCFLVLGVVVDRILPKPNTRETAKESASTQPRVLFRAALICPVLMAGVFLAVFSLFIEWPNLLFFGAIGLVFGIVVSTALVSIGLLYRHKPS